MRMVRAREREENAKSFDMCASCESCRGFPDGVDDLGSLWREWLNYSGGCVEVYIHFYVHV